MNRSICVNVGVLALTLSSLAYAVPDACDAFGELAGINPFESGDKVFFGSVSKDFLGRSMATGDFTGDGVADLLVGAGGADLSGGGSGAAFLLKGPLTAGAAANVNTADAVFVGPTSGDNAGWSVANAGDVNDDGIDDILVGAPGADGAVAGSGAAYVVFGDGSLAGLYNLGTDADATFGGGAASDDFGDAVAGVGDINGDGIDDLVVGAPLAEVGAVSNGGKAYAFYGPLAGTYPSAAADVVFASTQANSQFGAAIAKRYDYNGDGTHDVAIGANRSNAGGTQAGAVFVFRGGAGSPPSLSTADADFSVAGTDYNRVGWSLSSAGDVDGDGGEELWVGAYQFASNKRGAAFLVRGNLSGSSSISVSSIMKVVGENANDVAGSSVVGNIDFDADGYMDVLVGGERADGQVANSGAAWVVHGPFTADVNPAAPGTARVAKIGGRQDGDFAGAAVAAADINNDGFADAVVGAWNARRSTAGLDRQGVVTTYFGGHDIEDLRTFYADGDTDGWGRAATTTTDCSVPPGYSAYAGDCLDTDPTYYPYAPETCGGPDTNCDGFSGSGADNDGDGFVSCLDCDDRTVDVSPVDAEICGDHVDNNCDGGIDDALSVDAQPWCPDVDLDGYGDDAACVTACADPEIFLSTVVNVPGDCDDADAGISPAAFEMCDLVDNNCDGLTDDASAVDASVFYADGDTDGFGNFYDAARGCEAPSGYVSNEQDCDDEAGGVNPAGGPEACDYFDNDCDGIHYLGGPVSTDRSRLSALGSAPGNLLGAGVSFVGDLDAAPGDGFDEVAIGAPYNSDLGSEAGALYIVRGSVDGGDFDFSTTKADGSPWWDLRFRSNRLGSFVGSQTRSGDFNGDGETDLLVGAYGSRTPNYQQGAFYVFFGPVEDGDYVVELDADFIVKGDAQGNLAGYALGVGDLDNDGLDDIVASAPEAAGAQPSMGKVFVFYGSPAMEGLEVRTAQAQASFVGTTSGDKIGGSIAVTDLNGDGFDDIAYGADRFGSLDNGALYVWYGGATRASGAIAATALITGDGSTDRFGLAVDAAGDVDGDGYGDLIVGSGANRAYYIRGGSAQLTSAAALASSSYVFTGLTSQRAGTSVAGAGDVDADGFDDLLISAHRDDDGADNAGGAYLVYGSDTWFATVDTDANKYIDLNNIESRGRAPTDSFPTYSAANRTWLEGAKLRGDTADGQLGESLAAGGDFNGDGNPDVLLGSPNHDASASRLNVGRAVMFVGGPYGHDNNEIVSVAGQTVYYWDSDADLHLDVNGTQFTSCPMHAPISFRDEADPRLRGKPVAESLPEELDDCDDNNFLVYPGATEVSGDGLDRDCDGYDNINREPNVNVALTPSTLYASTAAVANVTVSDPDGDVVTLSYEWYVDGVLVAGESTNTLAPTYFSRNQVVQVSVMADDGRGLWGPYTRSKTVQNSKPTLTACNVAPGAGTVDTDFSVVAVGLFDDDATDGALLTLSYRWEMRLGPIWAAIEPAETSTTLQSCVDRATPGSSYNCRRGSRLRAVCIPQDPVERGLDYNSNEVVITNGEPVVTQCALSPAAPDTTQNITVSMAGTDPDADTITLSNVWLKNSVEDGAAAGTTYLASSTEHFDIIQARCTAYDGEGYSDPVTSAPVTVINTPPGAPTVDLTPNLPRSEQDLSVAVVTASTDIDADTITYDYYWTQNGTPYANPTFPSAVTTVLAAATIRGDIWEVNVVANDGYVDGGSDSDFVTIGNTAPTFTSAGLTPAAPTTINDITATGVGWYDDDGDPETYNISWFVNGVVQPPQSPSPMVLDDTFIVRGDEVYATLQARDPFTTGPTHTTGTLNVVNAVPTTPVVAISGTPSGPIGEDSDLNCDMTTTSTDADGDVISYTYAWYKDLVLQGSLTTATVDDSLTSYGEVWYCTVTPSDGFVSGDTATSATVAIQDLSAPPAPVIASIYRYQNSTALTISGTCVSGALNCNSIALTCTDATDTETYTGIACSGDAFSQGAVAFDRGETTTCSAKCYDSTLNESLASNSVTSEACNPYDLYEDGAGYGDVGTTPYDEWADLPDNNSINHTINSNIVADDTVDWYRFTTTDNAVADAAAQVNNYKFELDMTVGDGDYNLWVYLNSSAATPECSTTGPYDDYTEDVYDRGDALHHVAPGNRNSCTSVDGANWNLYNKCESFAKDYYVRVLREFDTDCQHYQLRVFNGRP